MRLHMNCSFQTEVNLLLKQIKKACLINFKSCFFSYLTSCMHLFYLCSADPFLSEIKIERKSEEKKIDKENLELTGRKVISNDLLYIRHQMDVMPIIYCISFSPPAFINIQ